MNEYRTTRIEPERFPYPDNPVSVYTALMDPADGRASVHLGVFTTEELARDACQEYQEELVRVGRQPTPELDWIDDATNAPGGGSYVVILTTLDVPTGQG